ncbi:MAG: peptidoglycan bridge formation glycyltransferase FemA/FemB family protein [Spirochaetes bacterium]|nr:peptidoglycan bridge formation glycyltransferase FemA/FemB family protein [Spirochaetota bacterium]
MLTRRIARLFRIAYVPFGPTFDPGPGRSAFLAGLARSLRPQLPGGTFLLRFDLPWPKVGERPAGPGLRKAWDDIQPPATVLVDLRPSEEAILAAMKPKTRYNVKLAEKRGVTVETGTAADLDRWYALYRETSARDRIAIHSRSYYEGLFSAATDRAASGGQAPAVRLLLARAGGELLAGNIVLFWRKSAVYLTGASSGEKRNLMPTYALQWAAMRLAKAAGCESYDLYGCPPAADESHPMFGLYQFKTGFSTAVTERWGTWDAPLNRLVYALYAAAERLRMWWYRKARKRFRVRRAAG